MAVWSTSPVSVSIWISISEFIESLAIPFLGRISIRLMSFQVADSNPLIFFTFSSIDSKGIDGASLDPFISAG